MEFSVAYIATWRILLLTTNVNIIVKKDSPHGWLNSKKKVIEREKEKNVNEIMSHGIFAMFPIVHRLNQYLTQAM